jgi:hypothetical protein
MECRRIHRGVYLAFAAVLWLGSSILAVDFDVPTQYPTIQSAINACPESPPNEMILNRIYITQDMYGPGFYIPARKAVAVISKTYPIKNYYLNSTNSIWIASFNSYIMYLNIHSPENGRCITVESGNYIFHNDNGRLYGPQYGWGSIGCVYSGESCTMLNNEVWFLVGGLMSINSEYNEIEGNSFTNKQWCYSSNGSGSRVSTEKVWNNYLYCGRNSPNTNNSCVFAQWNDQSSVDLNISGNQLQSLGTGYPLEVYGNGRASISSNYFQICPNVPWQGTMEIIDYQDNNYYPTCHW